MSDSNESVGEQTGDRHSLVKKMKSILGKYDVGSRYAHIPLTKASVLLPVLIRQGKLHLLLTVRSMKLKTMPGGVCFPGGRWEPSDQSDIQTALRETKEEIGLRPEQVEIIGRLIPCISQSPIYLITPVVGIVEDTFQPSPNPSEVNDVFLVPLEFFISTDHYTQMEHNVPNFGTWIGHQFLYHDPDTKKIFNIWGVTAHFAVLLSVILLGKEPAFDSEFDLESRLERCEKVLLASCHWSKL
ncbi:peroxisomal coenzyme A diphosphatase NUDT7-like isoform X1 [Mixophyes fleayi]|uniref:peroxisomal coenzyme A diphosphatase NUDT7-like isoform X1 n=1 Tax=Mixophyes fleayi TaxID=3061075 RepID=UPI003F4E2423